VSEKDLPFREHLVDLRKKVLVTAVAIVITTGISFAIYGHILNILLIPAKTLSESGEGRLVYTELTGMIAVTFKVSLLTGLVMAFPVILYQVIMFVAPGLTPREKRYLLIFLPGVLLSFGVGIAFGYFLILPPMVNFLLRFGADLATPMIRISNYVNVVVMLLFWIGLIFETPLLMFLFARLGIVSPDQFAGWRRMWVVVAFVLGAIITPTFDPINQCLVAIPLILLYEVGIWLSKFAARGRAGQNSASKHSVEG